MHPVLKRHAENGFFANAYLLEGADMNTAAEFFAPHGSVEIYTDAKIDIVRALRERAALVFGPARQFYILNADALNWQSYPALLKLIEEPPRGHHFILCVSSADSAPETIRSRAVLLACKTATQKNRELPAYQTLPGAERSRWLEACADDPARFARMLDECEAWARVRANGPLLVRVEEARHRERTLNIGRRMCLEYVIAFL